MEIIYITVPNFGLAEEIATDLVMRNLVACANLIPKITSIYKWNGELQKNARSDNNSKDFREQNE